MMVTLASSFFVPLRREHTIVIMTLEMGAAHRMAAHSIVSCILCPVRLADPRAADWYVEPGC
jgi:hypothetical protein